MSTSNTISHRHRNLFKLGGLLKVVRAGCMEKTTIPIYGMIGKLGVTLSSLPFPMPIYSYTVSNHGSYFNKQKCISKLHKLIGYYPKGFWIVILIWTMDFKYNPGYLFQL